MLKLVRNQGLIRKQSVGFQKSNRSPISGACHLCRESDNKQGYSFNTVNAAMTPEKAEAIKAHAEAIAALLYEEADPQQLTTLAGIEKTVRDQLLEHVTPHIGVFLSAQRQE
jgi:hypothetical protein